MKNRKARSKYYINSFEYECSWEEQLITYHKLVHMRNDNKENPKGFLFIKMLKLNSSWQIVLYIIIREKYYLSEFRESG